jgi:hypothetical protein
MNRLESESKKLHDEMEKKLLELNEFDEKATELHDENVDTSEKLTEEVQEKKKEK